MKGRVLKSVHAEVNAIKKMRRRRLPRRGVMITSFRVYKNGRIKCGQPCVECYDQIVQHNVIKHVSWSDNTGAFTTMKTNQICRGSLYVSRGSR
jgi:deoxycytidylate deaminase